MQSGDSDLKKYMEEIAGNALYISPQIQNELISCIAEISTAAIDEKIRNARFVIENLSEYNKC